MSMLLVFALSTFGGLMVSRNRPFWVNFVSVGAFMGIGFAVVERDLSYLIATVVFGAALLFALRRGPQDQQRIPG